MSAKMAHKHTLADLAVELAAQGLAVFPCNARKRPATPNGFKDAETDEAKVRALFSEYSGSLIGVATGSRSGLFVIDFDLYKGDEAQQYLNGLTEQDILPTTRVHKTKNGGLHYFYSSEGGVYPNVVPCDSVDVKGDGGYVIWWPDFGGEVVSTGVVDAPQALITHLTNKRSEQAGDSIEALKAKILRAEAFHDSLARLAARHTANNVSAGEVVRLLIEALRGSVASSPHHPRHERWRQLLADEGGEVSRIVLTASKKYSPSGAGDALAEALQNTATSDNVKRLFKEASPSTREVLHPDALNGDVWPFAEQGYFAHENHDLMKQRFIMHPVLCEGESVLIAAEPKTGKTAISLTVGLHIACGLDLGEGLKVAEPRAVLYFGLEGRRAIRLRVAAWRRWQEERGVKLPEHIPLFVVEAGQNLMQEDARSLLVQKVIASEAYFVKHGFPTLGAIFIDTFTKSMPGGDQNSVEDTSSVFDVVGMMRDQGVTASVVFIHHKARAGNIRGSSNIEADPDVLTSIDKDGHEVRWSVDRARSVEEGGSYRFMLHNYDLGLSEQGYMINAPVVEATDFSVDSSDSVASAKLINAVMNVIIGLGDGTHKLQDVIDALAAVGFGPQSAVAKAKVRAASKVAQTYFADLIPDTGHAFGKKTVVRQMDGAEIVGLFVR